MSSDQSNGGSSEQAESQSVQEAITAGGGIRKGADLMFGQTIVPEVAQVEMPMNLAPKPSAPIQGGESSESRPNPPID